MSRKLIIKHPFLPGQCAVLHPVLPPVVSIRLFHIQPVEE